MAMNAFKKKGASRVLHSHRLGESLVLLQLFDRLWFFDADCEFHDEFFIEIPTVGF